MNSYQDIRHMTRPVPSRPRMPRQNRAKLFAPYQALKGFGEAVHAKDAEYEDIPESGERPDGSSDSPVLKRSK